MEILNKLASRRLCTLANVYIIDGRIIKYRWGSNDKNDIKYLLQHVNMDNALNLKTFTETFNESYDYIFTVGQIKKHIAQLIYLGNNVILQNNNKIEIYTNKEQETWFKDELTTMDLDKWDIEIVI